MQVVSLIWTLWWNSTLIPRSIGCVKVYKLARTNLFQLFESCTSFRQIFHWILAVFFFYFWCSLVFPSVSPHCLCIKKSVLYLILMSFHLNLKVLLMFTQFLKVIYLFFFRIEKRSKYSRRRAFDPDSDIDYINERNMKFNQKLERFYGKHTAEIKQNLERGTAV